MLNRKNNSLLAIMLLVCMIVSAVGPTGAIYAEDGASDFAVPEMTVEESIVQGELSFDLSEVGNVDWLHLRGEGVNNLTQIKKTAPNIIYFSILTDTTGYEGKRDRGGDTNFVSYSWENGMEGFERGSKDTGFSMFFPKDNRGVGSPSDVGWDFSVEPQMQETTVVFTIGTWQAKGEVRIYADDQLVETKYPRAEGESQIFRYQITVPEGVELKVEGRQAETLSNYGNMTLSGIAVSSEQVVNKVNLLNLYNSVKDMTQGPYTDESWAEFTAARDEAKFVLDNKDALQAEVNQSIDGLQTAKAALVKRTTNIVIDYTGAATGEYQFGDKADQQDRYQTFTPDEDFTSQYVQVSIRKLSNEVTNLIVKLYETNQSGMPTGSALHSVEVNKDEVVEHELMTIPFTYELEGNKRYALVLRQKELGSSSYRWNVMSRTLETKNEFFGKTENGEFKPEAQLGTGIMRVIKQSELNKIELELLLNKVKTLSSRLYTASSWTNLQLHKQSAQAIMNDFDAEQDEIDEAVQQLASALNDLVFSEGTLELTDLIASLESAKIEGYTADSTTNLQTVVNAAKSIDEQASEQDKADAVSSILGALERLQPVGKYRYETHRGMTAAFGFEGDKNASLAFMDGSYQIGGARPMQHGPVAPRHMVTFGVTNIDGAKWYKGEGYLPVFISEYSKNQVSYKIETFGNKHSVDQKDYVVNYSRMTVTNNSLDSLLLPVVSSNLIALNDAALQQYIIQPGETVIREYVIEADKYEYFDESVISYSSLTIEQLLSLGNYTDNYEQMKTYWNNRLAKLVQFDLPNKELVNAFKAGYIDMMIIKDDDYLHVGENGYARLFSHDTLGIVVQLIQSGDFTHVKEYLKTIPLSGGINVENGQIDNDSYWDTNWKLPWVYAVYYSKTGDASVFEEEMTADDGSVGTVFEKRIKAGARSIEADRTAAGIMKETFAIDSHGYWTIDNYSALTGLTAYEYLARELYEQTKDQAYLTEAEWAEELYTDLLEKLTTELERTIERENLNYIPISVLEGNDKNRAIDSRDANWASMYLFGRWLWDGYLYGAIQPEDNINLTMLDDTYKYGIERRIQEGTTDSPYNFGGYPHGFYSSSYNAGYGSSALRGELYRDIGIKAYEFMIEHSMSAPFSWWEGINYPEEKGWEQTNDQLNLQHTPGGGGSAQHMWGQSVNSKVLVDSLIAERIYNENKKIDVIIGRGISKEWVDNAAQNDNVVALVKNYPVLQGSRVGYKIERELDKLIVTLEHNIADISQLKQEVQFSIQLPSMTNNIAAASTGSFDAEKGIVNVPLSANRVEITLADLVVGAEKIRQDRDALQIGYAKGDSKDAVTKSLQLPNAGLQGSVITWASSHPEIVSAAGEVIRPNENSQVTLTAQLKLGDDMVLKQFTITVLKKPSQSGGDNGTPGNGGGNGTPGNEGDNSTPGNDSDNGISNPDNGTGMPSNGGDNGSDVLPKFTDITEHWAKDAIEEAVARRIVNGYPDGTFRPEAIVTRSEFTVMMGRLLKAAGELNQSGELSFKDAASIPDWAMPYVADGVAKGYITGYGDHTFKPNGKITRLELVAMIVRAIGLPASDKELKFADASEIPAWGTEYVVVAYEAGIITGKNNNRFAPNEVATRAEAVMMLARVIAMLEAK